jgi:hypothetical protein
MLPARLDLWTFVVEAITEVTAGVLNSEGEYSGFSVFMEMPHSLPRAISPLPSRPAL